MKKAFIYTLSDPETGDIRYVGKTINPDARYSQHVYAKDNNKHKTHWIISLRNKGLLPVMDIVETCNVSDWQKREIYWIDKISSEGHKLTNIVLGGQGYMSAYYQSDETVNETLLIYADGKYRDVIEKMSMDAKVEILKACIELSASVMRFIVSDIVGRNVTKEQRIKIEESSNNISNYLNEKLELL